MKLLSFRTIASLLVTTICFFGVHLMFRANEKQPLFVGRTFCAALAFGLIVTANDYVRLSYFGKGNTSSRKQRITAVLCVLLLAIICFGALALLYR